MAANRRTIGVGVGLLCLTAILGSLYASTQNASDTEPSSTFSADGDGSSQVLASVPEIRATVTPNVGSANQMAPVLAAPDPNSFFVQTSPAELLYSEVSPSIDPTASSLIELLSEQPQYLTRLKVATLVELLAPDWETTIRFELARTIAGAGATSETLDLAPEEVVELMWMIQYEDPQRLAYAWPMPPGGALARWVEERVEPMPPGVFVHEDTLIATLPGDPGLARVEQGATPWRTELLEASTPHDSHIYWNAYLSFERVPGMSVPPILTLATNEAGAIEMTLRNSGNAGIRITHAWQNFDFHQIRSNLPPLQDAVSRVLGSQNEAVAGTLDAWLNAIVRTWSAQLRVSSGGKTLQLLIPESTCWEPARQWATTTAMLLLGRIYPPEGVLPTPPPESSTVGVDRCLTWNATQYSAPVLPGGEFFGTDFFSFSIDLRQVVASGLPEAFGLLPYRIRSQDLRGTYRLDPNLEATNAHPYLGMAVMTDRWTRVAAWVPAWALPANPPLELPLGQLRLQSDGGIGFFTDPDLAPLNVSPTTDESADWGLDSDSLAWTLTIPENVFENERLREAFSHPRLISAVNSFDGGILGWSSERGLVLRYQLADPDARNDHAANVRAALTDYLQRTNRQLLPELFNEALVGSSSVVSVDERTFDFRLQPEAAFFRSVAMLGLHMIPGRMLDGFVVAQQRVR